MAIEAANQVRIAEAIGASLLRLTNIRFLEELPLSSLKHENGTIETQLVLRLLEGKRSFEFSISADAARRGNYWDTFCAGQIDFVPGTIPAPPESGATFNHDARLLEYINSFEIFPEPKLDALKVNGNHGSGNFSAVYDDAEDCCIEPSVLTSLMQIPQMLLLGSGLPAMYRHESIDRVEVALGTTAIRDGNFSTRIAHRSSTRSKADLSVRSSDGDNAYIDVRGLRSRRSNLVDRKAPSNSLFYRPLVFPDITYLHASTPLMLSRVIGLLTHKWPMIDIGVMDLSAKDQGLVMQHLRGIKHHERPRFRSLHLVSDEEPSESGRVRIVKGFGVSVKLHLVFIGAQTLPSSADHLRGDGFACTLIRTGEDRKLFDESFDVVCEVGGFGGPGWLLGRARQMQNGILRPRKLKVLGCDGCKLLPVPGFEGFEAIQLEEDNNPTIPQELQGGRPEQFGLIVLDCGKGSMLATWSGSRLLPWIQTILEKVGNLLWVCNQMKDDPFSNVAGSFIRTVQSEHPSVRAASLVFKDNSDTAFFSRSIFRVYDNMIHGTCEVEIIAQNSQICALRYQPDDDLSASVGILPSQSSDTRHDSCNYGVSLATRENVTIMSNRFSCPIKSDGGVHVAVKASVIDHDDVVSFLDTHHYENPQEYLGQFFMGSVILGGAPDYEPGTAVVGWCVGAHSSSVQASRSHTFAVPDGMLPAEAAAEFAAHSIALLSWTELQEPALGRGSRSSCKGYWQKRSHTCATFLNSSRSLMSRWTASLLSNSVVDMASNSTKTVSQPRLT